MKITAGPYLQNVGKDGITVMWHTDEPGSSTVEYEANTRLGYSAYDGKPEPSFPQQATDKRACTIHAVTIGGLRPGWEYFYRVVSVAPCGACARSANASFRTAPADDSPFRFASYGDSQHVPLTHARICELVRSYRPDIVVDAGDIVPDQMGLVRERFFDPAANLLRYTPWFAAMGNHDSTTELYTQLFSYPEPRYWYSFNYGCAHFVVLNSNTDYRPGSEQYVWLQHDLSVFRDARWTFVFFHHPPYCSNNCQVEATRVLCPLLESAGVDLVYNAHGTHYERFYPMRDGRVDPDGVVYLLVGGGGCETTPAYARLWDHLHGASAMARGALNFFVLTHVSSTGTTVRAIDSEGRLFDALTLRKDPGDTPPLPPGSARLPFPEPRPDGTIVAGFPEGPARWLLPRPDFVSDDGVSRSGGTSIRWRRPEDGVTCPAVRRVLVDDGKAGPLVGGKALILSGWVRTEDVVGGVTLSLEWNGDMGFLDRAVSAPLCGTNDWTPVRVQTPALPQYVYTVRILASAEPDSTGTAWIDDLQVDEA